MLNRVIQQDTTCRTGSSSRTQHDAQGHPTQDKTFRHVHMRAYGELLSLFPVCVSWFVSSSAPAVNCT
eukprot:1159344-Pelagomonas_calceolata.AAC.9